MAASPRGRGPAATRWAPYNNANEPPDAPPRAKNEKKKTNNNGKEAAVAQLRLSGITSADAAVQIGRISKEWQRFTAVMVQLTWDRFGRAAGRRRPGGGEARTPVHDTVPRRRRFDRQNCDANARGVNGRRISPRRTEPHRAPVHFGSAVP